MPCCTRFDDADGKTRGGGCDNCHRTNHDGEETNGQFADSNGKAAIVLAGNNTAIDEIGPEKKGFRWVTVRGM